MPTAPDSIQQVNKDIVALWTSHFDAHDSPVHWPMISPPPVTGGLAAVGCNPALPKSSYYTVPIFVPGATDNHLNSLLDLEGAARKSYPYYKPFHRLAADLGLPLEHIDLFFYRVTSQKNLKPLIASKKGTLNEFGAAQVALAARILALAQPKIILVANAFAAGHFKRHFNLKRINDDDGLYWVTLAARKVPVFLSSHALWCAPAGLPLTGAPPLAHAESPQSTGGSGEKQLRLVGTQLLLEWSALPHPPASQVVAAPSRLLAANVGTPLALWPGRPTAHGAPAVRPGAPEMRPLLRRRSLRSGVSALSVKLSVNILPSYRKIVAS